MPELERRGHRCVSPDVRFRDPAATYGQRAAPAIEALRGVDEPVAVVGHSLAAGVAPLVATGAPGVRFLVYLCPAPTGPFEGLDVGTPAIRNGFPFPSNRDDGTSVWQPDAAVAAMYPRLPRDVAQRLAARLQPGASAPDAYPLAEQPAVAAVLVLAREDEFFEPEWSRRASSAALGVDAVEMDTGHFPMVETPDELAGLLDAQLTKGAE